MVYVKFGGLNDMKKSFNFEKLFPKFTNLSDHDIQTAAKVKALKLALSESVFLVTVVCLSDLLSCKMPLSRYFQKVQIYIKSTCDMLDDTLKILSRKREKCDVIFSTLYEEICSLADILDVKIKMPRLTKTQRNRENYLCDTALDYFRRSIYIFR